MKCTVCGVNDVDGRKIKVCQDCVYAENEERMVKKEKAAKIENKVAEMISELITEEEVKLSMRAVNSVPLHQIIVKAVTYDLLSKRTCTYNNDGTVDIDIFDVLELSDTIETVIGGHIYAIHSIESAVTRIIDELRRGEFV